MSNAITYPFDPSGQLVSNRITAEHQTISPPELSEFHFIIPGATPFFAESMVVVHLPSQRTLVEGVDYVPSHYFHDASLACARPIYGSLIFMDSQLTGAVRMAYQTLGGDWTLNSAKIIEILSNKLTNPRRITWEQVADLPYAFPPIDHDWHLDDMVGMSEVVDVLEGIRDALIASGEGGLAAHLADFGNPHQTTKSQVGLGNVENFPVASIAEAQAGTAANRYLTVQRGAQLVQAIIGNSLTDHTGNSNNPHNTTKIHVGLGSVDNYPTASQAEAIAGSVNNRFMTPLRTAQLIAQVATNVIDAHIANQANPHNTTKAQVGLGLVLNYGIADVVAARAGLSNELYMTPAMTREAITAIALEGVADHIDNTANPHNTTKAQVGLASVQDYGIASQGEAEDGTLNTRYMTPLRSRQQIQAQVGTDLTNHINNSTNPHGTTKAQVGLGAVDNYATATDLQAAAGTAANLFVTPAGARALFVALGGGGGPGGDISAHLADLDNPHEVSKGQVGLGAVDNFATADNTAAATGTANNLFLTPAGGTALVNALVGNALSAHLASTSNPHNTTAAQVGAYSTAQADTLLAGKLGSTATAADSTRLGGLTLPQVQASAKSVEYYPEVRTGSGDTWTQLGEVVIPANQVLDAIPDIIADVTGGETILYGSASMYTVKLCPRNLALSTVQLRSETYAPEIRFGYTLTVVGPTTTLRLFIRCPQNRQPVTAAAISEEEKFFLNTNTVLDVEPASIVYLTLTYPAFARARTTFGDVAFGDTPNNTAAGVADGSLVEWVSVAHDDDAELECRAVVNSLRQEYGNYLPSSPALNQFVYGDMDVLDKWGWNATDEGILLDTNTVASNALLVSTDTGLNYTIEVEIGSTNSAAQGAGVLAAVVNVSGRPYAIAVVRTPGGLTQLANAPTSFNYKLKTVALHVGQNGSIDLGSANGTLMWSDTDTPADGRDPAAYVPTGNGWDTSGKVRIRVVRAGNTLTIDVSQFGTTAYVAAEQIVLDLTTISSLAQFVDRPSAWGIISIRQPQTTFKVLTRPRMYRDYVRLGVAGDNDKQRHYRHDGTTWNMTYLGIANPLVRPNRLYYSDWNGVMYQAQRNGRLRPILIEAYSRENPTLLTP